MSEIVEIITRNDYRIALAETGEPSELAAEPNLSAPPKKKAASKPKSAPAVSPTAVAAKPKAAPAKAAPKRKTPPAADAEEHPSKRVPVEAAPPPKAAAAKKNGAKPKAHPSATPDQGVAKQSTETPELIDFPVTFSNLEIAEGFLRKIGLDPKLKKFVAQVEEEHQKCAALLEDEYSLRDWFGVLDKQLKEHEEHKTMINMIIVIIEAVCRNLKIDVVHFGSLEKIRQRRSTSAVEQLLHNAAYVKAANFYHESFAALVDNMDNQCNLIGFVEYCVVGEVHILEPIKSIFAKAALKLSIFEANKLKYRGDVSAFIPMIAGASQAIAEYFVREAGQQGEEVQPEEEEEDEADLLAAALDF